MAHGHLTNFSKDLPAARTEKPFSKSTATSCDPIYPEAPKTKIRFSSTISPFNVDALLGSNLLLYSHLLKYRRDQARYSK